MCLSKISTNIRSGRLAIAVVLATLSTGSMLFADDAQSKLTGVFIEPTVAISKSSTQNVLGTSSSYTRYAGIKAGKQGGGFRYYLEYDGIEWKDAKASLVSGNFEYLIPLSKLSANSNIYMGINVGSNTIDGDYSGSKTKMSYGAQAGLLYGFTGNAFLDIGYRYVNTRNIEATSQSSFMRMGNLSALGVGVGWKW